MRRITASLGIRLALVALAASLLISGSPALAGFDEQRTFQANELTVRNLIGEVRVTGHGGSGFEVLVHVRGDDATADLLQIQSDDGASPSLNVVFPLDRERDYVYPALGSGSKTSFTMEKGKKSWLGALLGSGSDHKITVRGSGAGLQVWADIEIRVPAGGSLEVKHGVGEITAENVDGSLDLDGSSGAIKASRIHGDLVADTGSGHVAVSDIDGALQVDTGSGHVEAERCQGGAIEIDTGSGHVTVREVDSTALNVDTGSGHVRASAVNTDSASIDTGSGAVELTLDRMGSGDFSIDTGSGRVTLALPAGASATVRAETGSGSIDVDLGESIEIERKSKDELRFRIGDGAAEVDIDTGSGNVRIVRSN